MEDIQYLKKLEANKRYKKNNPDKVKEAKKRHYQKHKAKIKQKKKQYWTENPEKARRWRLGSYYRKYKDFSLSKYDELLNIQNGVCAICGLNEKGKSLAVDHCHANGDVRGLLCQRCNRGIGLFKDNKNLLSNAFNYLNK